jgi:acylglycerol lipase
MHGDDPAASARADRAPGPARTEGFFERGGGTRLYHWDWAPEGVREASAWGALVVLVHGYAEHSRRYDEFAQFLLERGHAVCRMDARGHGRSSGQRGYVGDFSEYVEDLAAFSAAAEQRYPRRPLVLIGHSNGGLTALRAVQLGKIQPRALVLSGPSVALSAAKKPVPDAVARWLSALLPRLPLPNGISSRELTHDVDLQRAHERDRLVNRVATPRWYWSMTLAGRAALAEASRLTLPVLTLSGTADSIVDPGAVRELHERIVSPDKELVLRAGEYHEVLNETDRRGLFVLVADWISRALSRSAGAAPIRPGGAGSRAN